MEKVKFIRGSEEKVDEIRKTLEEWGGIDKSNLTLSYEDNYYYVDQFGFFRSMHEFLAKGLIADGKAEIYELPPLKPKCEFKPFDKVLVRDIESGKWKCNIFSHKDEKSGYYVCVETYWRQCIPYEGNEALLGTTDNPK